MSATTPLPTWFPITLDAERVAVCSHVIIETARQAGFSRETYAAAVAQVAESLVGHNAQDDIDGVVLRFVAERLRATADAIDRSAQ